MREAWAWRFIDSWHSIFAGLYVNGTPLWMYYRLDIKPGVNGSFKTKPYVRQSRNDCQVQSDIYPIPS